jgi:hypothetical protein
MLGIKYWEVTGLTRGNATMVARIKEHVPGARSFLVHGEGKDKDQDILWSSSLNERLFRAAREICNAVFVPPIYWLYTDGSQCQFEQRYNLARTFRFARKLNEFGLPTVLGIASCGSYDDARLLDWLRRHEDHGLVLALNTQMTGGLAHSLRLVAVIEREFSCAFRYVLFGPSTYQRFKETFSIIPPERTTFVTSSVKHNAANSKYLPEVAAEWSELQRWEAEWRRLSEVYAKAVSDWRAHR